jgi:4-amino-4-deoxy-L-arabinose transferase-like glycosyltransferase
MTLVRHLALLAAIGALAVWFGWVGHMGSDDSLYIVGAKALLEEGPYLPVEHWGLRHPVVLPLSAAFHLFGEGELQAAFVSLIYFAALVLLVRGILARLFGPRVGLVGGVLVAVTPLFPALASITNSDLSEAVFVLSSVALYSAARDSQRSRVLLLGAGLLAGAAVLNRETAGILVLFYAALFLLGHGGSRSRFLLLGLGALLPVLAEVAYFGAVAGDPLYRFRIDLSSHGGPQPALLGEQRADTGNLVNTRLLAPWMAHLLNDEFGLLFILYIVAVWQVLRSRVLEPGQRDLLRLLFWLSLAWIPLHAYVFGLRSLPRYFAFGTAVAVIFVAVWWTTMLRPRRPILAGVLALVVVGSNLLLVDLSNKNPALAPRHAVAYLRDHPDEIVVSDPRTCWSAQYLLEWEHVASDRLRYAYPPVGAAVLLHHDPPYTRLPDEWRAYYHPEADWEVLEVTRGEPTVVGRVILRTGLDGLVVGSPLERLLYAGDPVTLYRVPDEAWQRTYGERMDPGDSAPSAPAQLGLASPHR